jgi:hypothetical protein
MKANKMPAFTASASIYKTTRHYCMMVGTPNMSVENTVALALDNAPPQIGYIDCAEFPNSITCNECNATGPGTFNCCRTLERADNCIINNPPEAPSPTRPRWGNISSGLGNSVFQVR